MAAETGYLLFAVSLLRLLVPSLALSVLVLQYTSLFLKSLFARLQESSFADTSSSYQRILDSTTAANTDANRNAVSLPPDQNGILPVVVSVRTARRGLVYFLLSSVVFSYFVDGAILIAHSIASGTWESTSPSGLWKHEEEYVFGSSFALTLQILTLAWQERIRGLGKFKKGDVIFMVVLLLASEATLLGFLARKVHLDRKTCDISVWTITHIALLATRVLLLLLSLTVFAPFLQRTDYLPNEYGSLVSSENGAAARPSNTYGTFAENGILKPNGANHGHTSNAASHGTKEEYKTPPAAHKKSFWARIKILSPYLWPKKSRTLQGVAREI